MRAVGLVSIVLAAIVSSAPERAAPVDEVATRIRAQIDSRASTAAERAELHLLYQPVHAPLWVEADYRLRQDVREAFALLDAASDDGLDPREYETGTLTCLSRQLPADSRIRPAEVASFDVGLSAALLRYLHHLHAGRINPRSLRIQLDAPDDSGELPDLLRAAIANHRLKETAAPNSHSRRDGRLVVDDGAAGVADSSHGVLHNRDGEPGRWHDQVR
jgi:murein L,D-transpeptidase YcbB/YkuD